MRRRDFLVAGLAATPMAACSSLKAPPERLPQAVPPEEHAATIAAMRPPKRKRPLVAVLLDNRGSETTDAIVPWSVLTRSGVADVEMVSLEAGPVRLMPTLTLTSAMRIDEFDRRHPEGADYVIVPAYHDPRSAGAVNWIGVQARQGATVVGICAGALPVGHAGLLDGRQGTTHWFHLKELAGISPGMDWVPDRRYVADRGVVTTTGVSASLPVSLALVEAIAGADRAGALALELGAGPYDARHDSAAFGSRSAIYTQGAANTLNFPGRKNLCMRVAEGVDEMTLALAADAWARTYRGGLRVVGNGPQLTSLSGLSFALDAGCSGEPLTSFAGKGLPGEALESALGEIQARFGTSTARLVAHQLEVIWRPEAA